MSDSRAIRKRKSAAALAMWLSRPGLCGLPFAVRLSRFRFCGSTFAVQPPPLHRRRFTAAIWPHGLWPRSAEKPPATRVARGFSRSWFDSSQARKTVRWRRFRGLLFAPEKRAMRTCSVCPVFVLSAPFTPRPGFDLTAVRPSWPDCTSWLWRCVAAAEKPHGGRLRDALGRFFPHLSCVFSLLIR